MFNPEKLEPEPEKTSEAKPEFGKVAEDIEADFFKREMGDVFTEVVHASDEGDKKWKVDLICQLVDGSHLGVQSCIAEDYKLLLKKTKDLVDNPLVGLEKIYPSFGEQKKREDVPKVLLMIKEAELQEAFYKRGIAGKGEVADFLPKELKRNILQQFISCLTHQLIGHPDRKNIFEPKINILNKEARQLLATR